MLPLFGGYWLPSGAALGYVYILNRWQTEMADTLATGVDPFKATSMLPTVAFTSLYLTVLFVTRKFLKDRPAYDCKPYMAVYNLYQVRSDSVAVLLPAFLKAVVLVQGDSDVVWHTGCAAGFLNLAVVGHTDLAPS